jgi:hypothetical protein
MLTTILLAISLLDLSAASGAVPARCRREPFSDWAQRVCPVSTRQIQGKKIKGPARTEREKRVEAIDYDLRRAHRDEIDTLFHTSSSPWLGPGW